MKDIVEQFKKSISKLTPEEFKKVWDEIETEIGTDYPVFNAKTNCFEYKLNNIEAISQNKADYLEIVNNVVINCTTEKSANTVLTILLKTLNGKLIKSSLPTFNLWYYYKENTCYCVNDKSEIMIRNKIEFDKENYIIITGEEFINMYNSQKI